MSHRKFLGPILSLSVALTAPALAIVINQPVTPATIKANPASFKVSTALKGECREFTVRRFLAAPRYLIATLTVREGDGVLLETHFPAFVHEKTATYHFAIPARLVATASFEIAERSFANSGGEPVAIPGGTDYRIQLSEFARE